MRDYAKLSPFFWVRGSGKRLRGDALGQVIAAYLSTAPAANMVGIFYVSVEAIAADTGHATTDVVAALQRVEKAGYAFYDFEAGLAWIPNHARFDLGETISPGDKRKKKLLVELAQVEGHRFELDFRRLYTDSYGLRKQSCMPLPELLDGASADHEPIRSDPIRSDPDPGRGLARPGFITIDLPITDDVTGVWEQRTFTKPAGKPIDEVWADFLGHFASKDFETREALIGRWSKWVGKQCEIAAKDRQHEYDRKDALDRRYKPPSPFTEPAKMTPEEQAALVARVPFTITNPRKRSA